MIDYARINGAPTQIDRQPVWQRNLRSEREYGQIKVKSDRRARYEMYQLVELVQEDTTTEQYLVQSDQAREVAPNYYEHTISLIEVMAIFDVIIPASRSFRTRTGQQLTIRDVLDVYIREIEYYHGYSMDYEIGAWLDKKLTEKEYDGQSMSTIFTNLFNAVRSNPKCYVDNGTYVLYPQPFSYRNTLIDPQGDTFYYEQNSMDYATKAKVQAKNAVYEDIEPKWFPSETGWIIPRSADFVHSESGAQYELDSDIVSIIKVEARALLTDIDVVENDFYETVDITPQVKQEEEYEALDTVSLSQKFNSINKLNCIRYDKDTNIIYALSGSGRWGFIDIQVEYLKDAIRYAYQQDPLYDDISIIVTEQDVRDIGLRVKYLKKRDVDYLVNRMNSKGMTPSSMLYSQTASTIDLAAQKENMTLMANRLGNNTEFVTNFFDEGEYIWQVGDYTAEGKVIVEAKYTEHHNGTYGEFELAENFANIKGEESISRDPSPYTITGKAVTTNVVEENYIVFSKTEIENNRGVLLTRKGIDGVRDTFEETPNEIRRIDYGVYKRPDQTPLHMSIMSGGSGLTSTFHVQWRRPIIAGWYLDEVDNATIKQPTIYTSLGPEFYLQNYRLYHTNGGAIIDTGDYPIIYETTEITDNALTKELFRPIDLGLNDSFAHTYVLHALSDDKDINVGYRFSELLALHNSSTRSFKLWKSDTPYTMSDQEPRSTDTLVADGDIYYNRLEQKLEVTGSETFDYWAITDGEGQIMVSANNTYIVYFSVQDWDITTGSGEEPETIIYASALFEQTSTISTTSSYYVYPNGNPTIVQTVDIDAVGRNGEPQPIVQDNTVTATGALFEEISETSDTVLQTSMINTTISWTELDEFASNATPIQQSSTLTAVGRNGSALLAQSQTISTTESWTTYPVGNAETIIQSSALTATGKPYQQETGAADLISQSSNIYAAGVEAEIARGQAAISQDSTIIATGTNQ